MEPAVHASASRWFNVWIGTWIAFMLTMFLMAGSDKLTAGNVVPAVAVNGATLALAVFLALGIREGRRVGGATALVGFFTLGGLLPIGIIAAGHVRHAHPWVIIATVGIFWLVTVRTLVAFIALLNRTTQAPHAG